MCPWSPIPKFPEVMKNLKKNFTKQAKTETIETEIIRTIGITKDSTIKNTIQIMERLGYLKQHPSGAFWILCQSKPYDFGDEENLWLMKPLKTL